MTIFLDISFYKMDCSKIQLHVLDHEQQQESSERYEKKITRAPVVETDLQSLHTNTDKQLHWNLALNLVNSVRERPGCRLFGSLDVPIRSGNIHFAPGKPHEHNLITRGSLRRKGHRHEVTADDRKKFHPYHQINSFTIGPSFEGQVGVLDKQYGGRDKGGTTKYFIKVVPTIYQTLHGKVIESQQFSVYHQEKKAQVLTHSARKGVAPHTHHSLPGVFFEWEISAFEIRYTETRMSVW
eukprot:CAMPEP_0174255820 /NCGR_PEP_ID=MMETSP0439-20130205/5115_1 /TAXON_ID=0 /ORGANISM="Stereomyxa ramosa, Strain Chinc5" /LENGTH=238 /DNA_ID=CAMNT_0015338173 /DNA_START=269 /DNA_END=982 /DNA_ORIENTATION=+